MRTADTAASGCDTCAHVACSGGAGLGVGECSQSQNNRQNDENPHFACLLLTRDVMRSHTESSESCSVRSQMHRTVTAATAATAVTARGSSGQLGARCSQALMQLMLCHDGECYDDGDLSQSSLVQPRFARPASLVRPRSSGFATVPGLGLGGRLL